MRFQIRMRRAHYQSVSKDDEGTQSECEQGSKNEECTPSECEYSIRVAIRIGLCSLARAYPINTGQKFIPEQKFK